MKYYIEQKDALGNWGENFTWNQGGNEFDTEDEALEAVAFIRGQYDIDENDMRVVSMSNNIKDVFDSIEDGVCMRVVERSDGRFALASDSDVNSETDYASAVIDANDEGNWFATVNELRKAVTE